MGWLHFHWESKSLQYSIFRDHYLHPIGHLTMCWTVEGISSFPQFGGKWEDYFYQPWWEKQKQAFYHILKVFLRLLLLVFFFLHFFFESYEFHGSYLKQITYWQKSVIYLIIPFIVAQLNFTNFVWSLHRAINILYQYFIVSVANDQLLGLVLFESMVLHNKGNIHGH